MSYESHGLAILFRLFPIQSTCICSSVAVTANASSLFASDEATLFCTTVASVDFLL